MTEWTLVVTVSGVVLGRQQELQRVGAPDTYDCHLYLVTQRPRMSVDPSSVTITDDSLTWTLRLQRGPEFDEHEMNSRHNLGHGPWSWQSTWPYEEFAIVHEDGRTVMSGVVGLLQAVAGAAWPWEAKRHEVLYVGQAFGRDGDRTAWDRLKSHSTVQRILAEIATDQQVWLTLAAVTDLTATSMMDPNAETMYDDAADTEHNNRVLRAVYKDSEFRERDSVALGEAGLIRYFQPPFNDRMKYNFPARKQVPLETARSLDFHTLVVELQGEHVGAAYGSESVGFDWLHFAGFTIHEEADRSDDLFAFLKPTDPFAP